MLCLTRKEIEAYCELNQVPYRHDETNFTPVYTRNKIRLKCIPYIEGDVNPSLVRVLGEHSTLYQEEEDFLREYTKVLNAACLKNKEGQLIFDKPIFEGYHPYMQKRILLEGIESLVGSSKDITLRHLQSCVELVKTQGSKIINLPYGLVFRKEYSELILSKEEAASVLFCKALRLGEQWIEEANIGISLCLVDHEGMTQKNEKMCTKYIDYGKIKIGLQIRTRRANDFIKLSQGTKKLKKFFIDEKIPKRIRDSMPLIADGDEIVWIIGSRLNADYYVTDETEQILEIQMTQGS